jgi:hypothetical protein
MGPQWVGRRQMTDDNGYKGLYYIVKSGLFFENLQSYVEYGSIARQTLPLSIYWCGSTIYIAMVPTYL